MPTTRTPNPSSKIGPAPIIRWTVGAIATAAVVTGGILTFARPTQAHVVAEASPLVAEQSTAASKVATLTIGIAQPTSPATDKVSAEPAGSTERAPAPQLPTREIDDLAVAPTPTPTAEPIDDLAAPSIECSDDFAMGRWTTPNAGTTGTPTSLSVDTAGSCETVTITMDATTPNVDITRIPFLNWTMLRFDTDNVAAMPGPDLVTVDGDIVLGALAFHDNNGPGVFISHPIGLEIAADVVVDGDTVTVEFRASENGDTAIDAGWGGEPYSLPIGGLPHAGLAVMLVTELEASGEIGVVGYARAPEANVVIRIWEGDIIVHEAAVLAQGPAYSYGKFSHNAFLPNGDYTVEIGWDSPSDLEELDVWYSTDVAVIGAP